MGIYLHLVDFRSPRGFEIVIPAGYRSAYQRMRVEAREPMGDLVGRIFQNYRNRGNGHPLDVIRIEAHGIVHEPNLYVTEIQFGLRMDESTVGAFRRIRPLWHTPYDPLQHAASHRLVFPRIEIHGCGAVPGCNGTLAALARAAGAPVFATPADQDVDARPGRDPFALEGQIFRFNPLHPGRPR
jgi:hypothetical protein